MAIVREISAGHHLIYRRPLWLPPSQWPFSEKFQGAITSRQSPLWLDYHLLTDRRKSLGGCHIILTTDCPSLPSRPSQCRGVLDTNPTEGSLKRRTYIVFFCFFFVKLRQLERLKVQGAFRLARFQVRSDEGAQ